MTLNSNSSKPFFRHQGFTLLELLITLVVASIVMAIAIPGMRDFNLSGTATARSNGLIGNFNSARVEALKSASNVRVTAAGGDWANGWTIALDRDMNSAVNGDDRVILEAEAIPSGFTLTVTDDAGAGAINQFFYAPNGTLLPPAPATSVRFTLKRVTGDTTINRRCVAIDPSGRIEGRKGGPTC